jgi:hypothetical protein
MVRLLSFSLEPLMPFTPKETASVTKLLSDLETVFRLALADIGSMHPDEMAEAHATVSRAQRDVPVLLHRIQAERNKTLKAARQADPALDDLLNKHKH